MTKIYIYTFFLQSPFSLSFAQPQTVLRFRHPRQISRGGLLKPNPEMTVVRNLFVVFVVFFFLLSTQGLFV